MPSEEAFLQAIIAEPDEDVHRLACADWLEEHGDADRAEFIRLQCRMALFTEEDDDYWACKVREEQLLKQHEKQWAAGLEGVAERWGFKRGFVEWLQIETTTFLPRAEALFASFPLRELQFIDAGWQQPGRLARLAELPQLARLRELDLSDCTYPEGDQLALFASPHLTNLTALDLQGNFFNGTIMPALASGPLGHTLRELKVGGDSFDSIPFGVRPSRWLAAGPWPSHLSVLKISFAEAMKAGGAQALAESPCLGQLTELSCYLTAFGDGGLQALAASRHLTKLRELTLVKNRIGDAGVQALTAAPWWGRLTALRLGDNRITSAGVAALLESPGLRSVRCLDLHDNRINDNGALALAASPHLRNVRKLHLYNNPIGKQAEQRLKKRFRKRVWM
jgi:uncharacterized protein (TIGR02996 family)